MGSLPGLRIIADVETGRDGDLVRILGGFNRRRSHLRGAAEVMPNVRHSCTGRSETLGRR